MLDFVSVWLFRTPTTAKGAQEDAGMTSKVVVPAITITEDESTPSDKESAQVIQNPDETKKSERVDDGTAVAHPGEQPEPVDTSTRSPIAHKRSPFRSMTFFAGQHRHGHKRMVTEEQEEREREKVEVAAKRAALADGNFRKLQSDKEIKKSALALQWLIVGSRKDGKAPARKPTAKPVTHTDLKKIKSQLMSPKTAGKVIAALRDLPMSDGPTVFDDSPSKSEKGRSRGPIHAVCLEVPDAEANEKHFSKLKPEASSVFDAIPNVASATLESLIPLFNDLHIVSLITAPDLGLGKTADEDGILAGAVPTAEAVINGAVKITPQLMALGYATSKAIDPDHSKVYPPADRISVITYWWGLEVCVPEPTIKYLADATNISHTVMNLLTALALIDGGVAEILPFIRYISQFIDFEWNAIKAQDKGKGVVCAATWIMPAAMIPRSWDFPDPPSKDDATKDEKKTEDPITPAPPAAPPAAPAPVKSEKKWWCW